MEYGVNHFFEKFEAKRKLKRNHRRRVLHAIGFEGGLMLATIPMVAYAMQMSIWQAIVLDFSLNHVYFGLYLYFPVEL